MNGVFDMLLAVYFKPFFLSCYKIFLAINNLITILVSRNRKKIAKLTHKSLNADS